MFPTTTHADRGIESAYHGRRSSHASQPGYYSYPPPPPPPPPPRPIIELPRPLEPRPTHHLPPSLAESSAGGGGRHDAFKGPGATAPDYRSHRQSLPGLRDILTPQPAITHRPSYGAPWPTTPSAAPLPASDETYRRRQEMHPPPALQSGPPHPGPPPQRMELPFLQTSPRLRNPPHSLPVSPYTGYPEARDYSDVRPDVTRQPSSASYMPANGAPSPYTPGTEDAPYRNIHGSADGPPNMTNPLAGSECQKKYLGMKDIPGEGSFHMYEGGFRIPTHVDGEQVNPAWGLTKANKPRKRLALACLDCREKKIKCEPGASSCLQCEKAKRPCRRAPTQPSPSETPALPNWHNSSGSPIRKGTSDPPQGSHGPDFDVTSKRRSRADSSPPEVASKKHRSASPITITDVPNGESARSYVVGAVPVPASRYVGGPHKTLAWEEDPYSIDPELVEHLTNLYFAHISASGQAMFPRGAFFHWLRTCADKSQSERMVLYAVLALGSVFADDQVSGYGKRCAQIAGDALSSQVGTQSLCVVQARLLIGLYCFAKGSYDAAWEMWGSATRASTSAALRYNTEAACNPELVARTQERTEFFLGRDQLAECKRRTFWTCFLMELYDDGTPCAVTLQDIFLRLPCADDLYERGLPSDAPFYNNGIIDSASTILTPSSPISPMARLALLVAIWNDVRNFTSRAVHRPDSLYREAYERQYEETHAQLSGWLSRLPDYLQDNEANFSRSIHGGYAGIFITLHALYHFILIRLNRYVRCKQTRELLPRNIRRAHYHAQALLSVVSAVQSSGWDHSDSAAMAPFTGYAILSAVDVKGAGGPDSDLSTTQEVINGGLRCLRELARHWTSARDQLRDSERRFYQIQNMCSRPYKAHSGAWLGRDWGMKDPLEKVFTQLEHDCIYNDDGRGDGYTRTYFDALRDNRQELRSPRGGLRIS